MAYDKAVDSAALDAALTDVADAIREKGGTTDTMTLEEMPGKIAEIQAGGATEPYVEETYDSGGKLIDAKLVGHTKVRASAFRDCSYLALTELPAGLTSIGSYAFYACYCLALTELPAGLTSIGSYAFYACSSLTLTELPAGLTSIQHNAFHACRNLATIELPAGITGIYDRAFFDCTGLETVTFKGKPESIAIDAFGEEGFTAPHIFTINVPWSEGEVANAPWGATFATINYNYTGG